jgi:hypothetical protein
MVSSAEVEFRVTALEPEFAKAIVAKVVVNLVGCYLIQVNNRESLRDIHMYAWARRGADNFALKPSRA